MRGWIFRLFFGGGSGLVDLVLDIVGGLFGFLLAAVGDLPARAFRDEAAEEQDGAAEHRADSEAEAPADVDADIAAGQQQKRGGGADGGAGPVTAVDDQVDAASETGGDEFIDGRVDGGVFAADAEAGDDVESGETPEIPGEGGEQDAQHADAEGDVEDQAAAEAVGEPAETRAPVTAPPT